jgi:hypothetical protein
LHLKSIFSGSTFLLFLLTAFECGAVDGVNNASQGDSSSMLKSFLIIGIMIALIIVIGIYRLRQDPFHVQQMKKEDGADGLKRWARGCYAIVFGPVSPERRGANECRSALNSSWDIHSEEEALETIDRLSKVPTGRTAWDLVRVVVAARLSAAAGFISLDRAQAVVEKIRRTLQEKYPTWEDMAADYDAVVKEKGYDMSHLKERPAAREIWKVVPFK